MSGFVEGIDRSQRTLFPAMLDDYVAEDNPVRAVDAFVEGLDLDKLGFGRVEPLEKGRPSYHAATCPAAWSRPRSAAGRERPPLTASAARPAARWRPGARPQRPRRPSQHPSRNCGGQHQVTSRASAWRPPADGDNEPRHVYRICQVSRESRINLQLEAKGSDFRSFSEGRPFLWLAVMAYARCARPRLSLIAQANKTGRSIQGYSIIKERINLKALKLLENLLRLHAPVIRWRFCSIAVL